MPHGGLRPNLRRLEFIQCAVSKIFSTTTAPGRRNVSPMIRNFSPVWRGQQAPRYCGSAARTAAYPRTRSSDCARHGVRAPKHRESGRPLGPELPVGAAVRSRGVKGRAHHGRRPLRLRRRAGGGRERSTGLADNWLRHIEDIAHKHASRLDALLTIGTRRRLAELNVIEQVATSAAPRSCVGRGIAASVLRCTALSMACVTGCYADSGASVTDGQSWQERYQASLQSLA